MVHVALVHSIIWPLHAPYVVLSVSLIHIVVPYLHWLVLIQVHGATQCRRMLPCCHATRSICMPQGDGSGLPRYEPACHPVTELVMINQSGLKPCMAIQAVSGASGPDSHGK